jgi:hypothetical protein
VSDPFWQSFPRDRIKEKQKRREKRREGKESVVTKEYSIPRQDDRTSAATRCKSPK